MSPGTTCPETSLGTRCPELPRVSGCPGVFLGGQGVPGMPLGTKCPEGPWGQGVLGHSWASGGPEVSLRVRVSQSTPGYQVPWGVHRDQGAPRDPGDQPVLGHSWDSGSNRAVRGNRSLDVPGGWGALEHSWGSGCPGVSPGVPRCQHSPLLSLWWVCCLAQSAGIPWISTRTKGSTMELPLSLFSLGSCWAVITCGTGSWGPGHGDHGGSGGHGCGERTGAPRRRDVGGTWLGLGTGQGGGRWLMSPSG